MAAAQGVRVGFVNGPAGTADGLGRPAVRASIRQQAFCGEISRD